MLLVKKIAALCKCSAQTLRYYDKKGILKPVYIDKRSGYRYYEEEQIIQFQTIRQLQEIGCSIKEIKQVLEEDEEAIIELINQKILEHERYLTLALQCKETYRQKKMELIDEVQTYVKESQITFMAESNRLIARKQNDEVILNFINEPDELQTLLNQMQKRVIIGLEDLTELKVHQHKKWKAGKIFSGWKNLQNFMK